MDSSTIFFTLLYGCAFFMIIYLFIKRPAPVIVYQEPVVATSNWWPWPSASYNWWPYWGGWWSGGGDGGYGRREWNRPRHFSGEGRPWGGAGRGANGMNGGMRGGGMGGGIGGGMGGGRGGGGGGHR